MRPSRSTVLLLIAFVATLVLYLEVRPEPSSTPSTPVGVIEVPSTTSAPTTSTTTTTPTSTTTTTTTTTAPTATSSPSPTSEAPTTTNASTTETSGAAGNTP